MLSGTHISTVSVYSVRGCGINCGQKDTPPKRLKIVSGELCRLYVNSESEICQGLSELFSITVFLAHFVYGLSKNRTGMLVGIIVCVFLEKVVIE